MKQAEHQDEHKKGWTIGYEDGYLKGLWASCQKNDECGRCLNTAKPYWKLIPDYGVVDLVRVGLEKKKDKLVRLLDSKNLEEEIAKSMTRRQGLSILMIAEEEVQVLAAGAGLPMPVIKIKEVNLSPTIDTKGVESPQMFSLLVKSIEKAEIIGIPKGAVPNYLPLLTEALKRSGIDLRQKKLTGNTITYQILNTGFLKHVLLNDRPGVVIVCSQVCNFQEILLREGVKVLTTVVVSDKATITKKMISDITARVCSFRPQIVLFSLPVIGPILATTIRNTSPLLAWDIGHLSPHILAGLRTAE
jgi:hypothetical protein